jgi:hypothetical protein
VTPKKTNGQKSAAQKAAQKSPALVDGRPPDRQLIGGRGIPPLSAVNDAGPVVRISNCEGVAVTDGMQNPERRKRLLRQRIT